jgi:hypothetical protein
MKILEVVKQAVSNLEALGISSMLVGSVASSTYAPARYTQDADFVVQLSRDKVEGVLKVFGKDFYVDRGQIEQAIKNESSFNLIHFKTSFKIDLFILRSDPYSRQEFSRRLKKQMDPDLNFQACVQTAEDALLSKLAWYRKGGETSENQWRDLTGILKTQAATLDITYLQKWAAELGVADLLDRARKDAEV